MQQSLSWGRPALFAALSIGMLVTGHAASASLTISGTPSTFVKPGQFYAFSPSVKSTSGRSVKFTVSNQPGWTFFSDRRGGLYGVPRTKNIGTYANIVITATDGVSTAKLPAFTIRVATTNTAPSPTPTPTPAPTPTPTPAPTPTPTPAPTPTPTPAPTPPTTTSVTLNWTPPTQNTDGTALTSIAGYRILYGTSASALDKSAQVATAGVASYTIDNLTRGTWYFSLKVYNSAGVESTLSNLVSRTIQ